MFKRIAALFVACFFAFATLALAQGSGMTGDKPVQQPLLKKEQPVDTTRQPSSQYQTAPDQTTTDKMDKKRTTKHPKKKKTYHKKSTGSSTTTPQ